MPFWSAIQLHHFIHSLANPTHFQRTVTTFENYCLDEGKLPQVLSKTYALLNSPSEQPDLSFLRKWEAELQWTFTKTQIQNILRFSLKSSICTKIQETNYKILTRWYYTPQILHKYYPATSDRCWKCQADRGALFHIFWSCPRLNHFWTTVRHVTQKFTDHKIPDNPAFFRLHTSRIPAKCYQKSIVRHLLNAAKACIPFLWKNSMPPSIGTWLHKVEDIKKLEDPILTAQNKQEKHSKAWRLWNRFLLLDEEVALLR